MAETHLRLSELTAEINRALSDRFTGRRFWVMADVTSHTFKADRGLHFFELVEKDPKSGNLLAKLSAKAWGNGSHSIEQFERSTAQRFTNNISVLIAVEIQYHQLYGLQANLLEIDINFTLGVLEQQRRNTLEQLLMRNPEVIWKVGEKYYTRNNQLTLPLVIQRIAVIASSTSAGAEDLRHTLQLNLHRYHFMVDEYHAPVQGDQFATEIVRQLIAIFQSGQNYDVVVITRGGGSQTDLLIFDNYELARAVARFPIPVITGIGHQRNESIVDWMAHSSTKTPTKAAEFILAHNRRFEEQVISYQQTIIIRAQQQFAREAESLSGIYSRVVMQTNRLLSLKQDLMNRINQSVASNTRAILFNKRNTLLENTASLLSRPRTIIGNQRNDLNNFIGNLKTFNGQLLKNQRGYLNHYQSVMKLMSPLNILKRGFAIVKQNDRICTHPDKLKPGEKISILMSTVKLGATLDNKTDHHATETDL